MGVADQRDALARAASRVPVRRPGTSCRCPLPAHLDPVEQPDGIEDDGLVLGEDVGGILVLQRSCHDVALRRPRPPRAVWSCSDAVVVQQRPLDLLLVEHTSQPDRELGQLGAVDDLPAGQSGSAKSCGSSVLGRTTTWSQRSRPCVQRVVLDEVAKCVTGLAGLADGLDGELTVAALLPPFCPVVPDFAAFDLDADDTGAFDGDDEVDLVILEVVGDPLSGDEEVVGQ